MLWVLNSKPNITFCYLILLLLDVISRYFFDRDSTKVYIHMDESGFVGIYDIDFETHETKSRNHDISDELMEIAKIYFDEVYSR